MANGSCRLSNNTILSQSVTIVTVGTVPTLVIDLPAGTYMNGCNYGIVIAQAIPTATATLDMPVAFSIGGVTTTVYPFTTCNCAQVTASQIATRTKYCTRVVTTPTGGSFRSLGGLSCSCSTNNLVSLPVAAT